MRIFQTENYMNGYTRLSITQTTANWSSIFFQLSNKISALVFFDLVI